jgi:hypothetical protein
MLTARAHNSVYPEPSPDHTIRRVGAFEELFPREPTRSRHGTAPAVKCRIDEEAAGLSLSHVQPLDAAVLAERRPLDRLWNWLAPILLTPLVILHLGYSYGEPNHVVYMPWVFRRIDPTLLVNDWFANTTPAHPNAIGFLVWAQQYVPLPMALLVLHVLSVWAVLAVTLRLVELLFEDLRVFYVALFLLLRWEFPPPGANTLWGNAVVPHNVAVPLCLLAFYLVLKDRPAGAGLVLGAATWIHIQLGAITMLILGAGMLWRWRRTGFGRIVLAGVLYLAVAAPTLWAQWTTYMRSPSLLSPSDYLYLHAIFRQPHHLIPSSWPGADWYRFFLVLALAAPAVAWRRRLDRQILTWVAAITILCVIGTVFVEWIPVKLIIRLQTFRQAMFVKFFAILFAARFLLGVVRNRSWTEKLCALAILTVQNYTLIGLCAALLFALRHARRWMWSLGLFGAGVLAGIAVVATTSPGIPMFWHSFAISTRGVWFGPAQVVFLAALLLWNREALAPALLSLILIVRAAFGLPYFSYSQPAPDAWVQFCQKVKEVTPPDAVFITPPYYAGFQLVAQRAEVGNWKCTPMVERELVEWKERLDDLAGAQDLRCSGWPWCASALAGGYARLREPEFRALAAKYGARYVITAKEEQHLHDFREVLRLYDFVLHEIPR